MNKGKWPTQSTDQREIVSPRTTKAGSNAKGPSMEFKFIFIALTAIAVVAVTCDVAVAYRCCCLEAGVPLNHQRSMGF